MLTEAATYNELTRNFRWDIPARFNIAEACCDRHADGTGRLALIYVDEIGATTRTSFDEVADASRRFANVLKADGLSRGDRVAVFLSQSLELVSRNSPALAREIQEFVKVQLAAHEYPRLVEFAETLPMTATGKVLRRELRARG
jgi:acyl-coenzyme A synthetase/AMP-(fatty) acid ligase